MIFFLLLILSCSSPSTATALPQLFSLGKTPAKPKIMSTSWANPKTEEELKIHPTMAVQYINDQIEAECVKPYWSQLKKNSRAIAIDVLNPCIETDPRYFFNITTGTPSPYALVHAIERSIQELNKKVGSLSEKYAEQVSAEQTKAWMMVLKEMQETLNNSGLKIYIVRVLAEQLVLDAATKADRIEEYTTKKDTEAELSKFNKSTADKVHVLKKLISKLPDSGRQLYEIQRCLQYYPELITPTSTTPNLNQTMPFYFGQPYLFSPYQQYAPFGGMNQMAGIMPGMMMGN